MKPVISFDKSAQKEMLEMLGIFRDREGFLVQSGKYIKAFDDGNPIHFSELGGMWRGMNGEMIYFKSDLPSLIATLDKIDKENKERGIV